MGQVLLDFAPEHPPSPERVATGPWLELVTSPPAVKICRAADTAHNEYHLQLEKRLRAVKSGVLAQGSKLQSMEVNWVLVLVWLSSLTLWVSPFSFPPESIQQFPP